MNFDLLKKLLQDKCSPQEIYRIHQWARTVDDRKVIDFLVEKGWYEATPDQDIHHQELLLKDIKSRIRFSDPVSQPAKNSLLTDWTYWSKIAATILIVISTSVWLYFGYESAQIEPVAEIPVKWISKETAWGEKLTFRLPDYSLVQLNSGSILRYPEVFGDLRNVELEGEAFFQVSKDSLKPFVVQSGNAVTTVLGTEFNVHSREYTTVALVEGKVQVEFPLTGKKILEPNELIRETSNDVVLEPFDAAELLGWRAGEIYFDNTTLKEVMTKLEQYYGVRIDSQALAGSDIRVSGTFPNQNLENILQGLSYAFNWNYKLDSKNKIVVITKQN